MLLALQSLLAALLEVGFRLAIAGSQGCQALLYLSQTHLRSGTFVLSFLALLLPFADFSSCLFQPRLDELHLALRCLGLLTRVLPRLLQAENLLLNFANLTPAEDHLLVEAVTAL